MRNFCFILLASLASAFISSGCVSDSLVEIDQPEEGFDYVFSFTEDEDKEWKAGFADYPVGEEEFYELDFGYATVPEEAGEKKSGFFMSGNNHSDDLFMYLYHKIDGLEPETAYQLSFFLEMASNAPRNSVGIGGSPGASVYLKAGALPHEPERIKEDVGEVEYWRTGFDKGNQSESGTDMKVLGNVGTDLSEFKYTYIKRSAENLITVTTNEKGELWLILGTDSGFEGTTTVFYTSLKVRAAKL